MPRSKEFEPNEALNKAMELFWRKGYFDTSLDELVEYTGVSRYGLYSTFGDKHELFLAALERYRTQQVAWLLNPLEGPTAALPEIKTYFNTLLSAGHTAAGRMGCFICNTAIELAPFDKAAAKHVQAMFARITAAFLNALNNAQQQGQLPPEFDVEVYADYLTGVAQGLFVLARSRTSETTSQHVVQIALEGLR